MIGSWEHAPTMACRRTSPRWWHGTSGWWPASGCWPRRSGSPRARDAVSATPAAPDGQDRQGVRLRHARGKATLLDTFEGRWQLIVDHTMGSTTSSRPARAARPASTRSATWPTCTPGDHLRRRLPGAARRDRGVQGPHGLDLPPGTPRWAATSATTSTSPSTSPSRRSSTTTSPRASWSSGERRSASGRSRSTCTG